MSAYLNKFAIHLGFNDEGVLEMVAYENSTPEDGGTGTSEP